MAIKVFDRYGPRANPADANYPDGSYRNESLPGANDGTPVEVDQINDWLGFGDALLIDAGIVPSGSPDTSLVSQRLDGLKVVLVSRLEFSQVGASALINFGTTLGSFNAAAGTNALVNNLGNNCTAMGSGSLSSNTSGSGNTALGAASLAANAGASNNTAIGWSALDANVAGQNNTAVGAKSIEDLTGSSNSSLGAFAGIGGTPTTVSNCTFLGASTAVTGSDQVQLGDSSTTTYAYGPVQNRSDSRDKAHIKPISDDEVAFFMDVEWRTWRWDYRSDYNEPVVVDGEMTYVEHERDGSKTRNRPHFGAIAQQVEESMIKHGVDFGGLQHHNVNGGSDVYSIGYSEFIGIQGEIIQRQQRTIDDILLRLTEAGI